MARIAKSISWLVGATPLVRLARLEAPAGARIVAKLESRNPSGSNKDRAALGMIRHAERAGFLRPGGTIVEASAGDTGLALAMVARDLGYRLVLTMPEQADLGRCNLLRALGAELCFTPRDQGMAGAIGRAEQLGKESPNAVVMQPFTNRANAAAHRATAREIWEDTDGDVGGVVCPIGTGGTAAGCIDYFRSLGAAVDVIGVEPASSAVLAGAAPGPHDLPGLGAGFVPEILNPTELAEIVAVREAEATAAVRRLAAAEGILTGPAGGAVLAATLSLAERPTWAGQLLVAILPDSGERYEEHRIYAGAGDAS